MKAIGRNKLFGTTLPSLQSYVTIVGDGIKFLSLKFDKNFIPYNQKAAIYAAINEIMFLSPDISLGYRGLSFV